MCIKFILTAEVVIAPAGVNITTTGVRHITAAGIGLRLLLPVLLLFLDVFVFCHENHLPVFRYFLPQISLVPERI